MLVRRHEQRVRRFLARLTRGAGADDLAQEVFLSAWRHASSWRGEGSYESWLLRIAWRAYLSDRRKRREEPLPAGEECDCRPGPELGIDIGRALAGLGERERAAALLCYGEGCSHGEAAAIMAIPLGTLKSLVARAREKMVAMLELEAK